MITDCHVHIAPVELFKPEALALMKNSRKDFERIERPIVRDRDAAPPHLTLPLRP